MLRTHKYVQEPVLYIEQDRTLLTVHPTLSLFVRQLHQSRIDGISAVLHVELTCYHATHHPLPLPSTGLGFHLFDDIHLDIGTSVMIFMGVISFYHHILCCCLWEILLLFICNLNLQKVAQIRKPIEKIVTSFLYKKDIFKNKSCFSIC